MARFDCEAVGSCKAWNCAFHGQRTQDRAVFEALGGVTLKAPGLPCAWGTEGSRCLCVAPSSLFGQGHTFVEVGGHNGITLSNSLFFEEELQWNGMLIEGNPETFPTMVANRPSAISVHGLLGSESGATPLQYFSFQGEMPGHWMEMMSGVGSSDAVWLRSETAARAYATKHGVSLVVSTVPLHTFHELFSKHNIAAVDMLSVDVEGPCGRRACMDF